MKLRYCALFLIVQLALLNTAFASETSGFPLGFQPSKLSKDNIIPSPEGGFRSPMKSWLGLN